MFSPSSVSCRRMELVRTLSIVAIRTWLLNLQTLGTLNRLPLNRFSDLNLLNNKFETIALTKNSFLALREKTFSSP